MQSLTETVQLTATVQDQNGQAMTGVTITWASRGNQVAAVDNSGLVTAAGNGMAIIEASAGTVVGTGEVTVEQQPAEVRVSPATDSLVAIGDTVRLAAEAFDANGHPVAGAQFAWASDDEAVVTVDGGGLVTAVGNGEASVTASVESVVGAAVVTVDQRPTEVRVSPPADTLVALGDTLRLSAEALDANGHPVPDVQFTWTSDDEAVVTVDADGLVTAVGNGEAGVTASVESVVGAAAVTVEQRPAEVRISPPAETLAALGDTVRLAAEAFDANGHAVPDVQFAWTSDDEAVVTVDADGLVTAVGNGEVGVSATTESASGSVAVTVEQRPVEVRVSPAADTLVALGDTLRLAAEALDANGHPVAGAQFKWGSDDESVATVDAGGLVTAVGNGEASVTASAESAAGSAAVTVQQRSAEVRVSPAADTLVALGDTLRLAAEALDANGHVVGGTDFTWASEDEAVVTVDADGLVTAVGERGGERDGFDRGRDRQHSRHRRTAAIRGAGVTGLRHARSARRHATALGGGVRCERAPGRGSAIQVGIGRRVGGYRGRRWAGHGGGERGGGRDGVDRGRDRQRSRHRRAAAGGGSLVARGGHARGTR